MGKGDLCYLFGFLTSLEDVTDDRLNKELSTHTYTHIYIYITEKPFTSK